MIRLTTHDSGFYTATTYSRPIMPFLVLSSLYSTILFPFFFPLIWNVLISHFCFYAGLLPVHSLIYIPPTFVPDRLYLSSGDDFIGDVFWWILKSSLKCLSLYILLDYITFIYLIIFWFTFYSSWVSCVVYISTPYLKPPSLYMICTCQRQRIINWST